jgi:hypothetical protein
MQNHSCSSSLWSQSLTHSQMPTQSSLQPKDSVSHMYDLHPCQHEQFHTTSINRTFPQYAILSCHVLIERSETPSIRSSPTRSIYLTCNYLHSPHNDNTNHINQDHIPEGFCVKVHTVVGNIGQLVIQDDLHILNDLRNIPTP